MPGRDWLSPRPPGRPGAGGKRLPEQRREGTAKGLTDIGRKKSRAFRAERPAVCSRWGIRA